MHVQGCLALDLPSCSNMPQSTFVHSSRSSSAHIRPVTPLQISFKMVQHLKNFFNRTSLLHPSPHAPDLCAKYEHRTVSCAWSNSCTSPRRIMCLLDSRTPSSLRLLLNVCTCTDPHVPPTNITSLIFHPLFSPTASLATFSRLLTRMSC